MKSSFLSKICTGLAMVAVVVTMMPLQYALAGTNENVKGYAFSDMPDGSDQASTECNGSTPTDTNDEHCGRGLGWISLNSTTPASSTNYGVNLNLATGNFEGYGWSEHGGWVKFNPTGPFPSGSSTIGTGAHVDKTCLDDKTRTCDVTGWIRFVAGNTTTWDGWVSMSGKTSTGANYGIKLLPEVNGIRKFSTDGYAWGDAIVGWVNFGYASVQMNPDPIDLCKLTNYSLPGDPRDGTVDPKTQGVQTTATMPAGYTNNAATGQCGIFGCPATNPAVTIDNGSCPVIPPVCKTTDANYNPFTFKCEICNPNNPNYDSTDGTCSLCKTTSSNYNPVTETCQACNPSSALYTSAGKCPAIVCPASDPNYNPKTGDCRICNPNNPTWNETTQSCPRETGPIKPIYTETGR